MEIRQNKRERQPQLFYSREKAAGLVILSGREMIAWEDEAKLLWLSLTSLGNQAHNAENEFGMTKKLQRLMKSPGLRFTVILCVVVAGMVALWESMPAPTKNEGQRSAMESWLAAVKNSFSLSRYFESAFGRSRIVIIWQLWAIYHAPINLYGQVIDQYGNPVADADVQAHVATSPTMQSNSGKKICTKTDASGFFAIERERGASMYVRVEKAGFYRYFGTSIPPGKVGSEENFHYGFNTGKGLHVANKRAPVVFHLWKADFPRLALIRQRDDGAWGIKNHGTPRKIPFNSARRNDGHFIEVQNWSDQTQKNAEHHYTWRMRISVPNGELAPRNGELDFTAPLTGYVPSYEFEMPASLEGRKWTDGKNVSFFVRFNDGVHARFGGKMLAGYDPPQLSFEGYLNPEPESRNLTADPGPGW
ncbi:MAG: carboxypeptidase-like regulatory domain-containing protein [Prosthecobacter sp.]